MYVTVTKPLTFEEFLAWDDGPGRDFELLDGIPVPLSEPNANHEDLIERLCTYLEAHCLEAVLPYVSRQSKQVRLKTQPDEKEKSRKADIVIFAASDVRCSHLELGKISVRAGKISNKCQSKDLQRVKWLALRLSFKVLESQSMNCWHEGAIAEVKKKRDRVKVKSEQSRKINRNGDIHSYLK